MIRGDERLGCGDAFCRINVCAFFWGARWPASARPALMPCTATGSLARIRKTATLIPNKLAETVRNFDVPPVAVYRRNVLRLHFKLRGLQFLAKCFNNTPRPFGILCLGFVATKGRSGIGGGAFFLTFQWMPT